MNDFSNKVPTFETCKDLQWQMPTLLVWITTKTRPSDTDIKHKLCFEMQDGIYYALDGSGTHTFCIEKYKAPTFDDIFDDIPKYRYILPENPYQGYSGDAYLGVQCFRDFNIEEDFVLFALQDLYSNTIRELQKIIAVNHLAEGMARFYLMLSKKGLLQPKPEQGFLDI